MVVESRVHLICGSTGAGKTTYAKALSARIGAVHFSIDQWMARLYWPDAAMPIDPAWAMERVERCTAQILTMAKQVALAGTPVVLDLGFSTREQRSRAADDARAAGLAAKLHFVDVSAEERWRRAQARESTPADEHRLPFAIDRAMFDYVESIFQPPDAAEMAALNGVRVTG